MVGEGTVQTCPTRQAHAAFRCVRWRISRRWRRRAGGRPGRAATGKSATRTLPRQPPRLRDLRYRARGGRRQANLRGSDRPAPGARPAATARGTRSSLPGAACAQSGRSSPPAATPGDWEAVGSSGLPPLLGGGCGDAGQREPTGQPLGGEASSRPTPTGGRFGHMLMTVGALSYLEVAPRDEPD
jgi:hypothetical protein